MTHNNVVRLLTRLHCSLERHSRRDVIAADLQDQNDEQRQKRRLRYLNRFMTRTVAIILEHYGIDLDNAFAESS